MHNSRKLFLNMFRPVTDCLSQPFRATIDQGHGTFSQPVDVFGQTVRDGDLVQADRPGALVIPPEAIDGLAAAIEWPIETE